jgi:cob(I)alamin adenosyltransferase
MVGFTDEKRTTRSEAPPLTRHEANAPAESGGPMKTPNRITIPAITKIAQLRESVRELHEITSELGPAVLGGDEAAAAAAHEARRVVALHELDIADLEAGR